MNMKLLKLDPDQTLEISPNSDTETKQEAFAYNVWTGIHVMLTSIQLLNPKIDIGNENELLESLKLLVSGDRCEGRFVFGRKVSKSPGKEGADKSSTNGSSSIIAEHDNSKNHLQTLLLRAGHQPPTYKSSQLKNNKFRSTVVFNGLDFVGQPCGSKKLAEKSAASEALQWLTGETQSSQRAIDHI